MVVSSAARGEHAGDPIGFRPSGIERLTGLIAVLGGALALAAAMVATASVLMRWLFSAPIDGDFEYVKMATAVAVFAFLPYTQARRGNIMIDTFTGWLPEGARRLLDAIWDLVYAGVMGYLAYSMTFGALGMYQSGETTMQRQLPLWPSVAICTALALLVSVTALITAVRLARAGRSTGASSPGSSA
jgi:TRAP-type C4-dicarboxylate transport system permease small subunit